LRAGRHLVHQQDQRRDPNGDKGPVDVTLDFDNGSRYKIPNGFRFVEAKQTGDMRKAFFNKPGEKKVRSSFKKSSGRASRAPNKSAGWVSRAGVLALRVDFYL
jgi:hypothetical protein